MPTGKIEDALKEPGAVRESAWQKLRSDFLAWCQTLEVQPKIFIFLRLIIFEPGFQLTFSIRLQEALVHIPIIGKLLRRIVNYITAMSFGSQVNTNARIGGGIYIPHPWDIMIGSGVEVGRQVSIFNGVSLGRGDFRKHQYPRVKDGAILYAGAKIFGRVTIGEKSVVGSNAVVLISVPDRCVVAGIPAEIVWRPT